MRYIYQNKPFITMSNNYIDILLPSTLSFDEG